MIRSTTATNATWNNTRTTSTTTGTYVSAVLRRELVCRVHNKYHDTAPEGAVSIMRGTTWGNPFRIGNGVTREVAIARFTREVLPNLNLIPLIGKHLICCCKPKDCHGDPIIAAVRELERARGMFCG